MYCQDCPKKDTCKEMCKELNAYLHTTKSDKDLLGIERSASGRQIRRKEVYLDPNKLEWLAGMKATRRLLGMTDKSDMAMTEDGDTC